MPSRKSLAHNTTLQATQNYVHHNTWLPNLGSDVSPEQRLCRALLRQSLVDVLCPPRTHVKENWPLHAYIWLFHTHEDGDYTAHITMEQCCQALGLNVKVVQEALRARYLKLLKPLARMRYA